MLELQRRLSFVKLNPPFPHLCSTLVKRSIACAGDMLTCRDNCIRFVLQVVGLCSIIVNRCEVGEILLLICAVVIGYTIQYNIRHLYPPISLSSFCR